MDDELPATAEAIGSSQIRRGPARCHPANIRFHDRIVELRTAAEAAGRLRQARGFMRVLQSLKRYPLPVRSAHDAAGLEGVGKAMMSIFEEVFESSAANEEVGSADDTAWLRVQRRRFQRALEQPTVHGGPANTPAVAAPLKVWKSRLSGARKLTTDKHVVEAERRVVPLQGDGADMGEIVAVADHGSPPGLRESSGLASGRSSAAQAKGGAHVARRRSLGANCRRSAANSAALSPGSPQWCVLVALGLYAGDVPDHALAWPEIEQCVAKLQPLLPRCSGPQRAAAFRLLKRGLVEDGGPNKYRLTASGSSLAEAAVRKLEVPLTALSPVRLSNEATAEGSLPSECPVGSSGRGTDGKPEGGLSDDDKPLALLRSTVADVASPLKRPRRMKAHASCTSSPQALQECSAVPSASSSGAPHSTAASDEQLAQEAPHSSCRSPSSGLIGSKARVPWSSPSHNVCARDGDVAILSSPEACDTLREMDSLRFQLAPLPLPPLAPSPSKKRRRALQPANSAPLLPAPAAAQVATAPVLHRRPLSASSSAPAEPPAAVALAPAAAAPVRRLRPSGRGRLVLVLDHREVGAGREHAARGALLADLAKTLGADAVENRALPLGDVLWLWREDVPGAAEGSPVTELVSGWVIERKTFHDLSASIVDGRYEEQKIRLLEAPGLDGVVYLVEGPGTLFGVGELTAAEKGASAGRGFGQRLLKSSLPTATLSTTAAHTQLISGFHVVHTTSTTHTLSFLVAMHRALQELGPPGIGEHGDHEGLVPYRDFAERTRKSCHPRVFEAFGRMLRVVPHCGPEATEALVDEFQTPHQFAAALRDSSDTDLLLRLKARRGGRAPVSASALAACRELFAA